ncbi:hypothetical protein B484DRAFT_390688, partial [Ochromonadaceae sp. CCMP2298]
VVCEFVGDVVKESDYVENGLGVTLPDGNVLDCGCFARKKCMASMCNVYKGLQHAATGEQAVKSSIIVLGLRGTHKVFLVSILWKRGEQHTTYGKKFGNPATVYPAPIAS